MGKLSPRIPRLNTINTMGTLLGAHPSLSLDSLPWTFARLEVALRRVTHTDCAAIPAEACGVGWSTALGAELKKQILEAFRTGIQGTAMSNLTQTHSKTIYLMNWYKCRVLSSYYISSQKKVVEPPPYNFSCSCKFFFLGGEGWLTLFLSKWWKTNHGNSRLAV